MEKDWTFLIYFTYFEDNAVISVLFYLKLITQYKLIS